MTADFWETVFRRTSVRRYLNRPVPPSIVEKIIRAASHAPSAHNNQPWHFVVISSPENRNHLAEKMAEQYERDMISHGIPAHTRKKRIHRSLTLFTGSPIIIVPFLANKRKEKKKTENFKHEHVHQLILIMHPIIP